MRPFAIVSALVMVLFVAGCGDQVQKAKPPEKPAPEAGLPAGHPPLNGSGPAKGGSDPFAEGGHGAGPAMQAAAAGDPTKIVLSGDVSIDPAVKLGSTYVVYLSAVFGRDEKAPVYIKRYETPKFPFPFEVREADGGMGKRPEKSEKPLYLRVMISDSGDPMNTRNRTTSEAPFPLGTKDIHLTIKP